MGKANILSCGVPIAYNSVLIVFGYKETWALDVQITISKVFMVCDSALAKDVEPRFEIYDHQGRHLQDKDDLLTQPRLAGGQQV